MPLLDELSDDAADLGAVNTVAVPRRADARPQHRLVGLRPRLPRRCSPTPSTTGSLLIGAGGAGVAVGYGLLRQGAARVDVLDADEDARRRGASSGWPGRFGPGRVAIARDLEPALAERPGASSTRPRSGMLGHPGSARPVRPAAQRPLGQRRRLLPAGDRARRDRARARLPGAARWRDGGPAGRRRLRVLHRSARRLRADDASLRGADRLMRKGIATVSLSGVLERQARRGRRRRASTRSSSSTTT